MIRYELQANWGSVADFYILKELLKNNDDNVTEYIILVGDKHRENIQKVFDKFDKIIQNKGDTYQTYVNSKSSSSSSKKKSKSSSSSKKKSKSSSSSKKKSKS